MGIEPNAAADGKANVVALWDFQTVLTPFDAGEPLEAAVRDLTLPGIKSKESSLLNGHTEFFMSWYSTSPFVPTVLNTLSQPWPWRCTIRPLYGMRM